MKFMQQRMFRVRLVYVTMTARSLGL